MNFYPLVILLGASVREKQRFAMLFQSVVLPCHYHTPSIQTPVVQWWYKSYCRDRTRDSFTLSESLGVHASELGASSQLECADSRRTVRVVASAQGPSITLAEHYKGRDITIINKADLRIGELRWGDSGVYFCKVVIADDVQGQNEDHLELLVLGRTGQQDDLLPEFELEIMPEWAFVGSVVLGSILFLLLVGICWCQCCPHSCCCYVRCCCCPDTCCCPRHLYEAGKMAKNRQPAQVPVYPYYIPAAPSMVPLAPSSYVEPKVSSIPSVENNLAGGPPQQIQGGSGTSFTPDVLPDATSYYMENGQGSICVSTSTVRSGYRLKPSHSQDSMTVLYYIEKELAQFPSTKMAALQSSSLSELSSLHDGGNTDFRHTYQTVQMKALPPIEDFDNQSLLRVPPPTHSRRHRRDRDQHSDDEQDNRWNPRSENLQRKTLDKRGPFGSLDELEEFARSYGSRARRAEPRDRHGYRDYPNNSPPRRFYREEDDGWRRRSTSPLPQKRRDTWDSERPARPSQNQAQASRDYDDTFLNSVLENKARGRRGDRGAGRVDEDSDTPSKGSSRGKGSDSYYSRSPSNRPEEEDPLPPYSEVERSRRAGHNTERYRTVEPPSTERYGPTDPAMRPFSYTRAHPGKSQTVQGSRQERERCPNLSISLSRDSLVV